MSKYRIRPVFDREISYYNYRVEKKGWLFWSDVRGTDDPRDFEMIVREDIDAERAKRRIHNTPVEVAEAFYLHTPVMDATGRLTHYEESFEFRRLIG